MARASEVFAERWTPIIIRNLLVGCRTFSQIEQGAPGIPRALLTQRLRRLEQAGLVERVPRAGQRGSDYQLTPAGRDLHAVCDALGTWGARWLDVAPADLDPGVLLWAISRFIDVERLPKPRVVVRIDLPDRPKERFWLVLQSPEPEVCRTFPGYDEDLVITAATETLTYWHLGRLSFRDAVRGGQLVIEGSRSLVRAFPTWGGTSPFAEVQPAIV